jgi:hypothetical protein
MFAQFDQSLRQSVFDEFKCRPLEDTVKDTLVYLQEKGFAT